MSVELAARLVTPAVSNAQLGVPAAPSLAVADDDDGFSFDDLLDVVNPLQHIPIVGTLYRALSGDTIKTLPKIAGDALFGGLTGFASSVADAMFEKVTGKNVGDTVLALVEDVFSPSQTDAPASAAPALVAPENLAALPAGNALVALRPSEPVPVQPAEMDAIVVPGQDALLLALSRTGIGQDVALRAADAYRRTASVTSGDATLNGSGFRTTLSE